MRKVQQPPEKSDAGGQNPALVEAALQDYAMIETDRERRIVHWNKGAELTLGYLESEVQGQLIDIIYTPEDLVANNGEEEFQKASREGVRDEQRWHVRKNGSRVWMSGTLRALRSERGELEGFSKIARDTTAQKLAELQRDALLQREQSARAAAESGWKQLEEVFENLPALVALLRLPEQTYIFANRMLRESGEQQNLIGRNIREAHPDVDERFFQVIDEVARSRKPYTATEFEIPVRAGVQRLHKRCFNLVLQPGRSGAGEFETLLLFATDVTTLVRARQEAERLTMALQGEINERKRAEELARLQAEMLREQAALLDLAQDAITALRLDGTITFWNRGAEQLFGWSKEEALGKNIHELLHTEFAVPLEDITTTLLSQGQWSGDLHHTTRDGTVVEDLSRWVLREEDGEPGGWLQIDRDVTEMRRLEKELTERQKTESLVVLAGGVAHDFNNLLTGILGNISLARDIATPASGIQELLARSEESCEQAADLIQQMLAYAGKGQFTVTPIDVTQMVRDMVQLLRSIVRENVDILLGLAEGLPPIQADVTQLKQVVINLILNAAESIEGAGTVQVRTRAEDVEAPGEEEPWDVGGPEPGRYVALEVKDSGSGIDPAIRAKIFEPFFTTKFAGRGLGLAAVAGIVRSLHGAARISSKPGQGTSVTVLFPAGVAHAPQTTAARYPILVVDDDQTVRDTAAAVLRNHGYGVLLASNGREAVNTFRQHEGQISIVLLDIAMPVMGGVEAFRELKKLRPDLCVIILTGFREQDAVQNFGGLGVAAFIAKPYTSRHLLEVVRSVLKR